MIPLIALHDDSGVIQITQVDSGSYGEDGTQVDGLTIHRVYSLEEAADISEFLRTYIWSDETDWWKQVPFPPNPWSFWDTTLEPHGWSWDTDAFLAEVRVTRDFKLLETDWMILPDSPLSSIQQQEAAVYRQQLRDLPSTIATSTARLDDVIWPALPTI